jgi:hypothetical protein
VLWHAGRKRFVSDTIPNDAVPGVEIYVDSAICRNLNAIEIRCLERKGIIHDILWATYSQGISPEQVRVRQAGCGVLDVQLFVKDRLGQPLDEEQALRNLLECILRAIVLPVSVSVRSMSSWAHEHLVVKAIYTCPRLLRSHLADACRWFRAHRTLWMFYSSRCLPQGREGGHV